MTPEIQELIDQNPEVMHYTDVLGLFGMIETGELWAFDVASMNDSTEFSLFFDSALVEFCIPEFEGVFRELSGSDVISGLIRDFGSVEAAAMHEAKAFSHSIRDAYKTYLMPFVFCMSSPKLTLIANNGKLSQWRGYGDTEGYCLVFDTKAICQLFAEERESFLYSSAYIGNVFYSNNFTEISDGDDVATSIDAIKRMARKAARDGVELFSEEYYDNVLHLACAYKHWGFFEEDELRFICYLFGPKIIDEMRSSNPDKPEKQIHGGSGRKYIKLFSHLAQGPHGRLPINRVIVAPQGDSTKLVDKAKALLARHGYNVEVVPSNIPFLPK